MPWRRCCRRAAGKAAHAGGQQAGAARGEREKGPRAGIRTLPDGRREQEFAYVHAGWEQLLRMDVRTRRL